MSREAALNGLQVSETFAGRIFGGGTRKVASSIVLDALFGIKAQFVVKIAIGVNSKEAGILQFGKAYLESLTTHSGHRRRC